MKYADKYKPMYFPAPAGYNKWMEKDHIEQPPIWCSVDLRDGNQALIIPMSLEEKIEFFKLLVDVGFKEIEVGFPAASETEYEFCRTLIERNLIPDDVTIQVLTQAREHIIKKTFEAIEGAKNVIVHLYNSTSVAQREQVFKKDKEHIIQIAVEGAELLQKLMEENGGKYRFEYSPESFTGTEMDFALEICNAVLDVWKPKKELPAIINLPATVSHSLPHVYASQIEFMSENLKYRDNVVLSVHPHNDRGTGVADTELAVLAGADRVEGTLFGNGERTGNVDIITLALNMYAHGVEPNLDFTDLPHIVKVYEKVTRMHVYERQPYAGKLAVANVILNRVRSGHYPGTVTGVIYQRSQFSGVSDGAGNPSERFAQRLANGPRNTECMQAALEALSGVNNIGGYTSFRALYTVDVNNYSDFVIIGDHIFH